MTSKFVVYILLVKDPDGRISTYTGQTNNIERRLKEHQNHRGTFYLSHLHPKAEITLIYSEGWDHRSQAMFREKEIKKLKKREKLELARIKI